MYVLTLSLFFCLSFLSLTKKLNPKTERTLLALCMIWLVLHDGLRWNTGTDWEPYLNMFSSLESSHAEAGYLFLLSIVRSITSLYTIYLLIQAIFQYSVMYWVISRFSPRPLLSVAFFYFISLPLLGMNRQWICICILILSIRFILDRKFLPFIALVMLSMTFHLIGVIFVFAYFLPNLKLSSTTIIFFILISSLIGLSGILNRYVSFTEASLLSAVLQDKALSPDSLRDFSFSYIGAFKRYLLIFLFYRYVYRSCYSKENDLFFKMYFVGALIYLTFGGSWLQIMVGRGALAYSVSEIILMPAMLINFKPKQLRILLFIALFVIYTFVLYRDLHGYVEIAGEEVFFPYRSILF